MRRRHGDAAWPGLARLINCATPEVPRDEEHFCWTLAASYVQADGASLSAAAAWREHYDSTYTGYPAIKRRVLRMLASDVGAHVRRECRVHCSPPRTSDLSRLGEYLFKGWGECPCCARWERKAYWLMCVAAMTMAPGMSSKTNV